MNWTGFVTWGAALCVCLVTPVNAQLSPLDFETPEFYANWGLNVIGAQNAGWFQV